MDYKNILITMGDPAGVGPEITAGYLSEGNPHKYRVFVVGSYNILKKYIKGQEIIFVNGKLSESEYFNGKIYLINIDEECEIEIGKPTIESGRLSVRYLETAMKYIENGEAHAIVTAPISKEAMNMAGYKYAGHTEYFAEKTKTSDYIMILKGHKIIVCLNTTHMSLLDAVSNVKKERIIKTIQMAQRAKEAVGIEGTIAVAGLNPHNGENGLFGREEIEEIIPAVNEAQKMGIDVEGPVVPDSLFVKMLTGKYGIAVVMYHDQGLIPMKMESFGQGVNITVGLPFIRTSVDHGTAYDIAGKGIAGHGSLAEALLTAEKMIDIKYKNKTL